MRAPEMQNGRDAAAGIPATLHNTPLTLRLSGGYTRFTRDASPSRGHARRSGAGALRESDHSLENTKPLRRDLVELKRSGALRTGVRGSTGAPCGGSRVCGLGTRLAAGVAVLLDGPVAQRLPLVRRAAWSDGWIGHGSHSDRADERGGDWHRRMDAFDVKVGRPEGLRRRGLTNTVLRGRGIGSGSICDGKSDERTDEGGDEECSELDVEAGSSKGGGGEGGPTGRGGEGDVDDGGEDASGEGGASTILLAKFSSDTAEYDDTE
eukprot:scaffold51525_cov63-Phaeocystis_antarctica.AAC.8